MKILLEFPPIIYDSIDLSVFGIQNHSLKIKRDDLIHPFVSGNKFRKLKYNLLEAEKERHSTILTFGGAFSNHIAAVAAAGAETNFKTIGIIRGEELAHNRLLNPTLTFAQNCGMLFKFIPRDLYRKKEEASFLRQLEDEYGRFYLLPEGGTNHWAVKGCEEILQESDQSFDFICVPVGTGGTISGLVKASSAHQQVLGFSALKGTFQNEEVKKYTSKTNFEITDAYSFGGYGKIDAELIRFINEFKQKTDVPLDPIYTGKMLFGIIDLLKNGRFPENSSILAVHTGGLQGIAGMNQKLKKKNLPIIE